MTKEEFENLKKGDLICFLSSKFNRSVSFFQIIGGKTNHEPENHVRINFGDILIFLEKDMKTKSNKYRDYFQVIVPDGRIALIDIGADCFEVVDLGEQ